MGDGSHHRRDGLQSRCTGREVELLAGRGRRREAGRGKERCAAWGYAAMRAFKVGTYLGTYLLR